jgi:predicted nucleic acid-binding protein
MSRRQDRVFVDTGAWIALAVTHDPLHGRARTAWERLRGSGVRLFTSIPVVIETFTFLDRNATRKVALTWKDAITEMQRLVVLECRSADLEEAWTVFESSNLHKLSLVDAMSFALMRREDLRTAFAFDHHFVSAGFDLVE